MWDINILIGLVWQYANSEVARTGKYTGSPHPSSNLSNGKTSLATLKALSPDVKPAG
jgi:hypothetical protein